MRELDVVVLDSGIGSEAMADALAFFPMAGVILRDGPAKDAGAVDLSSLSPDLDLDIAADSTAVIVDEVGDDFEDEACGADAHMLRT